MTKREPIPSSELIINSDGSIFHLHIKPEQLADKVIVCGDPARVDKIASYLDSQECSVTSREFHTVTGTYKGKRLSIVSHGIGCDNIEIVLNELDALVNIDFETRMIKPDPKQLTIVRIGTSGGIQDDSPIGTYVAAEYAIGFDGVLHYYAGGKDVADKDFEKALIQGLDWQIGGIKPYVVKSPQSIVDRICQDDVLRGVTIACNGFYAPQGRRLRWDLADPELNQKIQNFNYNGRKITNFEMESSALAGIGAVLNHEVLTVCCIIAGRKAKKMNTDYKDSLDGLIELVLERI
ncbi:nucleoside phosphorylase [Porphyromonas sp.]|uniref:nucleoside phosphorylase n=1 Tax=Porphyromonas sp. TaxID=1924944 RepID=UPI0026DC407E|nr:nucleoside phosphorylase [Porphyromonas sp.]MDO4771466.1 nucleoside phosphorylase [Porphyromonas sp.]